MSQLYQVAEDGTEFTVSQDAHGLGISISRAGVRLGTVIVDSFDKNTSVLIHHGDEDEHRERISLNQSVNNPSADAAHQKKDKDQ